MLSIFLDSPSGSKLRYLRVSRDHIQTHYIREDSSGRVIGPSQKPLRDKTRDPQEKNFHATGGNRTRNPKKREEADPRLRPRDQRGVVSSECDVCVFYKH